MLRMVLAKEDRHMKKVRNPIPGGWCSDPSILQVGEDYYIAASTFEWMPSVSIYHSRDMIHWERLPGALQDDVAVSMEGIDLLLRQWRGAQSRRISAAGRM